MRTLLLCFSLLALLSGCGDSAPSGPELTVPQWQKLEIDFVGPATSENATENPFTDYRLDVNFFHNDSVFVVPGFYAADGQAAETSADSGSVWRVRFRPMIQGEWTYEAVMTKGADVATSGSQLTGERVELKDGKGTIRVTAPGAGERGRLVRNHPRYLQWKESGEYFLKGAADSPENFLAYQDFDGTYRHSKDFRDGESTTEGLHHFRAHEKDYQAGDPSWQDGKGKGMIGALNYLAGAGANGFYFLTMNINGDGKDVWPYVSHDDPTRFDCSKLDQWEIVFDHADDKLGLMLHFVLQETENETLLDDGDSGPERSLYVRELVARFGHHRAVTWNLGEENGPNNWSRKLGYQNTQQVIDFAQLVHDTDPYNNYTTVHTHPNPDTIRTIATPYLNTSELDGISLQIHHPHAVHEETRYWLEKSAEAGSPWIATVDEIGPWFRGVDPDYREEINNQDSIRALLLWGNLMAGGGGVEYYFGAHNDHNDLGMEDWRSRNNVWNWTGNTLRFFRDHVPFHRMDSRDDMVDNGAYCLAAEDEDVYLVYLPVGGETTIGLTDEEVWSLRVFDPQTDELVEAAGELTDGPFVLKAPAGEDRAFLLEKK